MEDIRTRKERADALAAKYTNMLMEQAAQGRVPRAFTEQARIDGPEELLGMMLDRYARDVRHGGDGGDLRSLVEEYCAYVADGLAWTVADGREPFVPTDEVEDYYILEEER